MSVPGGSPNRSGGLTPRRAAVVALAILSLSALGLEAMVDLLRLQLKKRPIEPASGLKLHSLPESFKGWRAFRDEVVSAEAAAELGTDNYLSRWYRRVDAEGRPAEPEMLVQLHCAYYTGMIDTVPHVPERCLVGGGMEYAGQSRVVRVPLDLSRLMPDPDEAAAEGRARLLTARNERVPMRVRLPREIENLSMMATPFRESAGGPIVWAGYFFMANGGVRASANDVRLLAFKLQDDYAYYAKVQFLSATVKSAEELAAVAGEILDEILPDLMLRVPDWTEVEEGRWPPDNPRGRMAATERL